MIKNGDGISDMEGALEANQMLLGWSDFDLLSTDVQSFTYPLSAWIPSTSSDLAGNEVQNFTTKEFGWPAESAESGIPPLSLRFLEAFTRGGGFIASFDCCTGMLRNSIYDKMSSGVSSDHGLGTAIPTLGASSLQSEFEKDSLSHKSLEIANLVEEVVRINPRNSAVSVPWDHGVHASCLHFFTPQRMRLYLELYWAIWHPNVNFMHRPSFDSASTKPVLLAAMVIIGACVAPRTSDSEEARVWFDCIEEIVFRDDDFCTLDEDDGAVRSFPSNERIQALQAAYMVCLFQNWEGSEASKRRIRRFRYSTVVAASNNQLYFTTAKLIIED